MMTSNSTRLTIEKCKLVTIEKCKLISLSGEHEPFNVFFEGINLHLKLETLIHVQITL